MVRYFIIALAAYLLALLFAVAALAQQEWFGSNDLSPYAVYSIPFAGILALVALFCGALVRHWPQWIALPLTAAVGLVAGYLSVFAVAIYLGLWFGAMSIPMVKTWTITGLLVLPIASIALRNNYLDASSIRPIGIIVALGILLFYAFNPMLTLLTSDQSLTVHFIRHTPGPQPLEVTQGLLGTEAEHGKLLELLADSGLTGKLTWETSRGSGSTDRRKAEVFIIFNAPSEATVRLPQPKRTTVVYLQDGDQFTPIPANAPTLERGIEIDHARQHYFIELASGAKSGGSI